MSSAPRLNRIDPGVDANLDSPRYVWLVKRLDVWIACAITAWMTVEVFAEHLEPRWAALPLMIFAGGSLAWRRSQPILVGLAVVGASLVQAAAGMTMHSAIAPVVALLLASWSIGAYEPRRRAVLGLTIIVCGLWLSMAISMLRSTDHFMGTDFPWIGALLIAPGVVGIMFGARTRSLREAEERARLLELERREAIAEERTRIARELHDVIAHSVSVMTVQAGAAEEMLKVDPSRAVEPVRAVQETGRQALVEMKRLVGMLREDDEEIGLSPQPGVSDIDRLAAQMREAGLPVELRVEGTARPVPIGVDLSAYRVVQEALTNALKHAGAASAVVTLRYGERDLTVEVTDEGAGHGVKPGGHGLIGMRERVGIFGGTFEAGPRESGGFEVRALLPFEGAA
jgi:signal transduction histidine kinase